MTLADLLADRTQCQQGLLAAIASEFAERGWSSPNLAAFRMEGEGGAGAGGAGGGAGGEGGGQGAGSGGQGGGSGTGADRRFTQEDLNRVGATEKEQGKRAALNQVQELLGCTPEEAKAILDQKKESERAAMDEATRIKAEADDARKRADADKTKADEAVAEANKVKRETLIERALLRAGLADDDDGTALAYALRMVEPDVPADADLAKALEVVNKAKEKFPALFEGVNAPPPPPGGGVRDRKPPAGAKTGIEAGRERARQEREAAGAANGKSMFAGMTVIGAS